MPVELDPEILMFTLPDIANGLSVGQGLLRNLQMSGQLRTFKIGGRVLVPRDEFERLLTEGIATGSRGYNGKAGCGVAPAKRPAPEPPKATAKKAPKRSRERATA